MTSLTIAARRGFKGTVNWANELGPLRLCILFALAVIAACSNEAAQIIGQSLADAFLQVTVFVAATLAIFYSLEAWFKIDAAGLLAKHKTWQVPIAAGLGALPGCGGAIMVITQYIRGGISFGSVVAVLTATMGDAAFLLLAQKPTIGASIFIIGWLTGIFSGYIVDAVHGANFLRYPAGKKQSSYNASIRRVDSPFWLGLWALFLIPGLIFGGFVAFQTDTAAIFGTSNGVQNVVWIGLIGAIISLLLWGVVSPLRQNADAKVPSKESSLFGWASASTGRLGDAPQRVAGDTCFVTVWVVFAYLIYELGVYFLDIDLKILFQVWGPLIPMIAVVIGFIPGCGPQIVVATMYLNGLVPLSAELGNAISNDGDALFPAIAMAPMAAIIATIYSAVPAIILAYTYYFLFE